MRKFRSTTDDTITLVERAADAVEPLIASMTAADHVRLTPCSDFTLAALVSHVIGGLRGFADAADGKSLRFDADDADLTMESAAHGWDISQSLARYPL